MRDSAACCPCGHVHSASLHPHSALRRRLHQHRATEHLADNVKAKLQHLLRGFNAAYNGRRRRVLENKISGEVIADTSRLTASSLAVGRKTGRNADIALTRDIVEGAKDVSQPDSKAVCNVVHWCGNPRGIQSARLIPALRTMLCQ